MGKEKMNSCLRNPSYSQSCASWQFRSILEERCASWEGSYEQATNHMNTV